MHAVHFPSRIVTVAAALLLATAGAAFSAPTHHKHAAALRAGAAQGDCDTPATRFCNALMRPLLGWKGHVFKLAQDYPGKPPAAEDMPWRKFDPRTQGNQYLQAALDYFYEGNIRDSVEDSFDPSLNTVRHWYNAPWQDFGKGGREFVHGLTRERVNLPGELDAGQKQQWNNYAVGFYNAPGGYTIGQVWLDHGSPNPAMSNFPDGTIAAKLLYTTAPVSEVPYLAGAPEWQSYIYCDLHINTAQIPDDPAKRKRCVVKVRLLQIDIAVKDSAAHTVSGWVLGTFVYGGGPGGKAGSGWHNVAPVGIMWGNDPGSPPGPLQETALNAGVHMPHVGWQGRLNGPVDNPVSACMSCHGTAEAKPMGSTLEKSPMTPTPDGNMRWFQNLPPGTPFDQGFTATDMSLQLAGGIANFQAQTELKHTKGEARVEFLKHKNEQERLSPREGGPID